MIKEIREVTDYMRDAGVKKFLLELDEITLDVEFDVDRSLPKDAKQTTGQELTEDEILGYSSDE